MKKKRFVNSFHIWAFFNGVVSPHIWVNINFGIFNFMKKLTLHILSEYQQTFGFLFASMGSVRVKLHRSIINWKTCFNLLYSSLYIRWLVYTTYTKTTCIQVESMENEIILRFVTESYVVRFCIHYIASIE